MISVGGYDTQEYNTWIMWNTNNNELVIIGGLHGLTSAMSCAASVIHETCDNTPAKLALWQVSIVTSYHCDKLPLWQVSIVTS